MRREDFTLTQERSTTYAKSMVDTAEKVVPNGEENGADTSREKQQEKAAPKARNTEEWVAKVREAIERVQQRQTAFREMVGNANGTISLEGLDRQQVRQFIQQLNVKEVEGLLQELRDLKHEVKSSAGKQNAEEVVLYERQLAAVVAAFLKNLYLLRMSWYFSKDSSMQLITWLLKKN